MNKAILMMGLPLAGKTTVINEKNLEKDYTLISADKFKESHPEYDPSNAHELHEWSVQKAEEVLEHHSLHGVNILLDSGSINNSYTLRIIEKLKSRNYEVHLIHVKTPLRVCLERNRKRTRKVPQDDIIDKSIKENKQFHRLKEVVDSYEVVDYHTNEHIFIDMDGVVSPYINVYEPGGTFDFVNREFFKYQPPIKPMIDKLIKYNENHNLYILSATPNSFGYEEKIEWLKKYMPFIPEDRIFFVNSSQYKVEMLGGLIKKLKLKTQYVSLIDDTHKILAKAEEMGVRPIHPSEFLSENF